MVDLDWKAKMVSPDNKSPKLSNKVHVSIPTALKVSSVSPVKSSAPASAAYEHYLRLPDLRKLWSTNEFPEWKSEPILKPALQALEITFRFISIVLSDPRPYANKREWKRRLESIATSQIELIAAICEDNEEEEIRGEAAPTIDLTSSSGLLSRDGSSAEVWSLSVSDKSTVVNHTSEASLLPRLATWRKSEDIAQKILYSIECEMRRCPYTLGLGEPNLAGKPNLDYDSVCKPKELYNLKRNPYYNQIENHENQNLYTTHQIIESWIQTSTELLKRIDSRIVNKEFENASSDCYILERIWKLLAEIEDLHLLMDPEDFLQLKNQLQIKSTQNEAFCFRSKGLVEITKLSKELKHKVPFILDVEVDPTGGPRVQEAAMKLYREKREFEKIHLLQSLQAIEAALKRFFYAHKQVLAVVMGSLEAKANRVVVSSESCDPLSQLFLEPTYFPTLDGAKTFLGEFWSHYEASDQREKRRIQ